MSHLETDKLTKLYASRVADLFMNGAAMHPANEKFIASGVVQSLLRLMLTGKLLEDSVFTKDFQFCALSALLALSTYDTEVSLESHMQILFSSNLTMVEQLFKAENVSVLKLMLGAFFLQRNLTQLPAAEFERVSMSEKDIIALRDLVFSQIAAKESIVKRKMASQFWKTKYQLIEPHEIQKWFNFLLLSDSNRRHMCDKQSFDYMVFGFDHFVGFNLDSPTTASQIFCLASMRSIRVMLQSCSTFIDYLHGKKIGGKLF